MIRVQRSKSRALSRRLPCSSWVLHPSSATLYDALTLAGDAVSARFSGFFGSPLRYPGGKGRLGPWLANVIEANDLKCRWYVEPYAGGAGAALYLLLHERVEHIVINDADPLIHAFWQSVVKNSAAFEAMIRETPVTMESRARLKDVVANPSGRSKLELGFAAFFLNRTSRSGILAGGVIGGKAQSGVYKLDARYGHEDLIARVRAIGLYDLLLTEGLARSLAALDPTSADVLACCRH